MIISFKYKFIFIKNYKTAGSSIETYLYDFLNSKDIIAHTNDNNGINFRGDFDQTSLLENFSKSYATKCIERKWLFFAHMPLWLVKERIELLSEKLKIDIFNEFFKFGIIRNPYDLVVSDYLWNNNKENHLRNNHNFEEIINEIENNKFSTFRLFNINRLSSKDSKDLLCDSVLSFENLNEDLDKTFKLLKIPFDGKLKIFKKKFKKNKHFTEYYSNKSKKIIEKFFEKEINYFNYTF